MNYPNKLIKRRNMRDYGMVSIITPSWNCASFLEETIKSIQAQTYSNWELLFQDDCSTDDTREKVLRMAAEDPRGPDPFFGPRRGAAPYLLVSSSHGSMAPVPRYAAHHPCVVSGFPWPAADAGAGVPAVKVASLHRVWAQEVLAEVQDRAPGQVL